MSAIVGLPVALVGTIIDSNADSPGLGIARVAVEFSPRSDVGDTLFRIDNVNGLLSQVYIQYLLPLYVPAANWDLYVTDAVRNAIYTKENIAVTANIDEPQVPLRAVAGSIYVNALNMGTSTERRARLTLVFISPSVV